MTACCRMITRGPKHHWFGYYDKLQFDPTDRYVLGMEVDFEHRTPRPEDAIRIGMVDLVDGDRWIEVGTTTAWCWQQGCMLQWLPGTASTIVWNDREDGRYVCRTMDVFDGEPTTAGRAVYAVSPDGTWGVSADFARIQDVRPGYGYVGITDPVADDVAPDTSGVWRVDLETGESELILSIAEIAATGDLPGDPTDVKHYVNHLLVNTDGSRFVFLHRWRFPDASRRTRMLTANPDGSDLRVVDDNGLTGHFIWRDPDHILAESDQPSNGPGVYLFEDRQGGDVSLGGHEAWALGGHVSYLPNRDWVVNDTYPGPDRIQRPYLYHVRTSRRVELGEYHSPDVYREEWRCDTHPRSSRDGRFLTIDSPHSGDGRQMYLLDIGEIVA